MPLFPRIRYRRIARTAWRYLPWVLLVVVAASVMSEAMQPNPIPWIAPIGSAAFLGLLVLYGIYAVRHWSEGNRWTAILMLVGPPVVYAFAATVFTDSTDAIIQIAVVFLIGAVVAGIFCAIGAWILHYVQQRGGHRRYRDSFPSAAIAFIALIVLSGIALGSATPSHVDENLTTIIGSMPSFAPIAQGGEGSSPPVVTAAPARTVEQIPVTVRQTAVTGVQRRTPVTQPEVGADLTSGPVTRSLPFLVKGNRKAMSITLYGGVDRYLDNHKPTFWGDYGTYYRGFIAESAQAPTIESLAGSLRSQDSSNDDARAAISLVQTIPYDYSKLYSPSTDTRMPYQVLYDNTGVCGEKSLLLAALLNELGYGVALLKFGPENHMAVGIRCPAQYAYKGTGYAFIEAANPGIPTFADGNYDGVGRLASMPEVIPIAEGNAFSTIGEEAADANEFRSITAIGTTLDPYHYSRWQALVAKYGIQVRQT